VFAVLEPVIVTVEMPSGVSKGFSFNPQPVIGIRATSPRRMKAHSPFEKRLRRQPMKRPPIRASAVPEPISFHGRDWFNLAEFGPTVLMVSVVVTGPPLGVIEGLAKEQVASNGIPWQLKVTAEVKLPTGATVRVTVPDLPWTIVSVCGVEAKVNVGSDMVSPAAAEVEVRKLTSPL
jgi:hypothetical protein